MPRTPVTTPPPGGVGGPGGNGVSGANGAGGAGVATGAGGAGASGGSGGPGAVAAGTAARVGAPAGPASGGPTGAPAGPGPARAAGPTRPGRPAGAPRPAPRPVGRRVRLAVARVDPWSAMKMSFLLSFAAGVGLVVATMVLWMILSGMNVFSDIDSLVRSIQPNSADPFSIMDWIGFPRVTSLAMVIAVIDVILLTALGTLGAYLYNICASLVGGVQLTLTDD
ncbi:MAG: DUF3566 domain-containing protein [Actinomycetales bacterium]|nr:DUF3566 domain-containing protein [Candidatus Phosphoribacter baldrii]